MCWLEGAPRAWDLPCFPEGWTQTVRDRMEEAAQTVRDRTEEVAQVVRARTEEAAQVGAHVMQQVGVRLEEAAAAGICVGELAGRQVYWAVDFVFRITGQTDVAHQVIRVTMIAYEVGQRVLPAVTGGDPLVRVLQTTNGLLDCRGIIVLARDILSGNALYKTPIAGYPDFIMFVSRVALFCENFLAVCFYLETLGLIAAETGHLICYTVFGQDAHTMRGYFSYGGLCAELADRGRIVVTDGFSVEQGLALLGVVARLVAVTAGQTKGEEARMVGLAARFVASGTSIARFVIREYGIA